MLAAGPRSWGVLCRSSPPCPQQRQQCVTSADPGSRDEATIAVIGEATERLSDEFRAARRRIRWRLIAGMRDRLIHHYDPVDLDEVWKTVTTDLPDLLVALRA